jgi:Family of unknown function (DUF6353)
MNLTPLLTSAEQIKKSMSRNSPTILTGFAVGGLIATVISAIKSTPKAMEILDYEKRYRDQEEQDPDYKKPIDILDTIELTWKYYIPTIVMGIVTTTCIIGANSIGMRRNAALASLFSITETTLKEYQAKVVETIGEKKEENIRSEIAKDKVNEKPPTDSTIILTNKGTYLCLDVFSGRYFRSDVEAIRHAENEFNHKLLREGWLSINDFYDILELDPIELGNEMGWIAQYAILEIKYSVTMAKNNEPCLVMDYRIQPKHI